MHETPFEVELDRIVAGGAALGPGPDGRLVFVDGGLPGERVIVAVEHDKKRFVQARLLEVVEPVTQRMAPACSHVGEGCGGCDWQHATPDHQSSLRHDIVVDALRRIGHIDQPDVRMGPRLDGDHYRTTVRAAVRDGRAGYRKGRSHDVVTPSSCLVAHPLVEELLVEGRFPDSSEVIIKAGARTGERLAVVSGPAHSVSVPSDVIVVGRDELERGRLAFIHEEVDGHRFRISADSFFQCRPDGAEVLADLVAAAVGASEGPLLDAYCGVGLFGALVADGRVLIGVESSRSSVADAKVNLEGIGTVVRSRFERWPPEAAATVIADPARRGLQRAGVAAITATGAAIIVLVSCDPASMARDAGLLEASGYELDQVTVVDMFGQTSHVEAVSRFVQV